MKKQIKNIVRSVTALGLAVCMIFNLSATASAAGKDDKSSSQVMDVNGDGKINYVAFGDSVTNGYGMEGYRYSDGSNVYGFGRKVEAAYPALITEYLEEQFGEGKVELSPMAISSFRMDELHAMLDEDGSYVADDYHVRVFGNWNRSVIRTMLTSKDKEAVKDAEKLRAKYPDYANDDERINAADAIIGNEYRSAIKNADLITIDLGTNNFGTFMTNKLTDLLGLTNTNYKMDFTQFMDEASYQSLEAMLDKMVAQMVGASEGQAYTIAKELAVTLLYGYLGFSKNFDAALDEVYRLNPDAQVVVIDVYNMMSGVSMKGSTFGENVDLAQLYGIFVDLANFYSREISPYAQKVTHASLDKDPGLFFDLYANYPEEPLSESAERLMEEFIMESMGYDPDYPSEREAFKKDIKDSIDLLDGLVADVQFTVELLVVNKILDGVQPAVEGVDAAIEGVPVAKSAVDEAVKGVKTAEEAVDTAVTSVETAQNLVDIIVEKVVNNSMFSTESNMKPMIISVVKSELQKMDLTEYGFENTEEDQSILAEEIYKVACDYKNSTDAEDAEAAAVVEMMRFSLVETKGYSEEEAQLVAEMALELKKINDEQGRKAAVLKAMETQVDANTAQTAYQLNEIYQTQGEDAAVIEAMSTQVDRETAALALQIYAVYEAAGGSADHENAKAAAVTAAIVNSGNGYNEEQAAAMYHIYAAVKDGDDSTIPSGDDFVVVLATMGITEVQARAMQACYVTDEKNGQYKDEDVRNTMTALMLMAEFAASIEEANELYDSYVVYKDMPETFSLISKNKTLYIDYLLTGNLDMGSVVEKFKKGQLVLEYPGDDATDAEKETYYSDSSVATMYMRFISQDGVFIHPSEIGQKELANCVKKAIVKMNHPEDGDDFKISEDSRILSIGDSIAAADNNYGQLVAAMAGTDAYNQFAVQGLRINEIRALIDDDYSGDAYTEDVLSQISESTGMSVKFLGNKLQADIADSDVILLNAGAMNLGFAAVELQKFTTDGTTYPMEFSNVESMEDRNLGKVIDSLLGSVQGMVQTNEAAPVMLALESYGYGLSTYADCIAPTIQKIRDLNKDAAIVLIGHYDYIGGAVFEGGGLSFAIGDFFTKAVDIMNTHLEKYADEHKDCVYIDVKDVETALNLSGETLNLANGTDIQKAMEQAHPTANGHEYIKNQIAKDYVIEKVTPDEVKSLTAANIASGIKISWEKSEDVDGYVIYKDGKAVKTFDKNSSVSYTDKEIKQGKKFKYSVAAFKYAEDGTKILGEKVTVSAVRVTVKSISNQNGSVRLTWTEVDNAEKYEVWRKVVGQDEKYRRIKTITDGSTSYTDKSEKSVVNGRASYYYVLPKYRSESDTVLQSNARKHYYISRPTISSVKGASKAVTVKWKKNKQATGYEITYSTSSSFSNAKTVTVKSASTLSKKISGLKADKKYYVKVHAYKVKDDVTYRSAWSGYKSVKTK